MTAPELVESDPPPRAPEALQRFSFRNSRSRALRRHILYITLGSLVTVTAWRDLFLEDASLLVLQDASEQTYPLWQYAITEIVHGRFPLWDPYSMGGRSYVGEGQAPAFYPFFLLLAVLGGSWATTIAAIHTFAVFHGVVAFGGAYFLGAVLRLAPAGAFTTGLIYALGGFFSARAVDQLNIYSSTAWVPFSLATALLATRKRDLRWAMLSGLAIALSILAGHVQPAVHAIIIIGIVLVSAARFGLEPGIPPRDIRRAALTLSLIAGSGAVLAAVQLLPMQEYQSHAVRWVGSNEPIPAGSGVPYSVVADNATLDVQDLPSVLTRGGPRPDDSDPYLGVVAVLLAGVGASLSTAPFRRTWLLLLAGGMVLAMGDFTPLLQLVHTIVPFVDRVRQPIRYYLLVYLALSVLAGLGVSALVCRGSTVSRKRLLLVSGWSVALLGLAILVRPFWQTHERLSALLVAAASACLVIAMARPAWRSYAGAGLVIALAIELSGSLDLALPSRSGYDGVANREVQNHYGGRTATGLREFFERSPGLYRVDFAAAGVPRNLGSMVRLPSVGGYGATMPARIYQLRRQLGFLPPSPASDMLATRYIVSDRPLADAARVEQVDGVGIYWNLRAYPLMWFVEELQPAATEDDALASLSAANLDFTRHAVVVDPARRTSRDYPRGAVQALAIERYVPGYIRVRVQTDTPAFVATSEPYFPGWVADIGGERTRIQQVNFGFKGVEVPPGDHVLELTYRPLTVIAGGTVSVIGGLTALALSIRGMASRRGRPQERP